VLFLFIYRVADRPLVTTAAAEAAAASAPTVSHQLISATTRTQPPHPGSATRTSRATTCTTQACPEPALRCHHAPGATTVQVRAPDRIQPATEPAPATILPRTNSAIRCIPEPRPPASSIRLSERSFHRMQPTYNVRRSEREKVGLGYATNAQWTQEKWAKQQTQLTQRSKRGDRSGHCVR